MSQSSQSDARTEADGIEAASPQRIQRQLVDHGMLAELESFYARDAAPHPADKSEPVAWWFLAAAGVLLIAILPPLERRLVDLIVDTRLSDESRLHDILLGATLSTPAIQYSLVTALAVLHCATFWKRCALWGVIASSFAGVQLMTSHLWLESWHATLYWGALLPMATTASIVPLLVVRSLERWTIVPAHGSIGTRPVNVTSYLLMVAAFAVSMTCLRAVWPPPPPTDTFFVLVVGTTLLAVLLSINAGAFLVITLPIVLAQQGNRWTAWVFSAVLSVLTIVTGPILLTLSVHYFQIPVESTDDSVLLEYFWCSGGISATALLATLHMAVWLKLLGYCMISVSSPIAHPSEDDAMEPAPRDGGDCTS